MGLFSFLKKGKNKEDTISKDEMDSVSSTASESETAYKMIVKDKQKSGEQYDDCQMEQFAYQREIPLSNRDILEMAAGQVKVEGLSDTQKQALQSFKDKLETQRGLRGQRNQLQQIRDMEKAKGKCVKKANVQIAELSRRIQTLEDEIVMAEDSEFYQIILKKARKTVDAIERAEFDERLKKYSLGVRKN